MSWTLTIGDISRSFDGYGVPELIDSGEAITWSIIGLTEPPNTGPPEQTDEIGFALTGFEPGDSMSTIIDIDIDGNFGSVERFYQVLFNNGASPNAAFTAVFDVNGNSVSLSLTLPDLETPLPFPISYDFEMNASTVPKEPTGDVNNAGDVNISDLLKLEKILTEP